jgi:hypothetical protein
MAAKKNLNNPNKPATKVRSTKGPSGLGGSKYSLVDDKKGTVTVSKPENVGKSNVGGNKSMSTSVSEKLNSTKSTALRDTKKAIKNKTKDGDGKGTFPSPYYAKDTKKGFKLALNKTVRAKKKGN